MKLLDGRAIPLFPLPTLVFYPGVVQPLHIFEPRYRDLLQDVLDSHGKIGIALLQPGYEDEYHGSPAIYPTLCVGTVVDYTMRDDGSSDVVLLGDCRARIVEEVPGKTYRQATLLPLEERSPEEGERRASLRSRLERWLKYLTDGAVGAQSGEATDDGSVEVQTENDSETPFENHSENIERLRAAFRREERLGFLVDFLAFHFIKELGGRQRLLEELDVERRADLLLSEIGDSLES